MQILCIHIPHRSEPGSTKGHLFTKTAIFFAGLLARGAGKWYAIKWKKGTIFSRNQEGRIISVETGFDNGLYIHKQTEHIRQRIEQWGGKLYLEFGGKLFDDYHAARVLPGFDANGKIRLLYELREQAEIIFAISAGDIL